MGPDLSERGYFVQLFSDCNMWSYSMRWRLFLVFMYSHINILKKVRWPMIPYGTISKTIPQERSLRKHFGPWLNPNTSHIGLSSAQKRRWAHQIGIRKIGLTPITKWAPVTWDWRTKRDSISILHWIYHLFLRFMYWRYVKDFTTKSYQKSLAAFYQPLCLNTVDPPRVANAFHLDYHK